MTRLLIAAALAAFLTACGSGGASSDSEPPPAVKAPIDITIGQEPSQIWPSVGSTRAVIWLHGRDQDQHMLGGPEAAEITALHSAGWSIGSDFAQGNAWGDAKSVADYKTLITYMKTKLHAQRIVLLGASMGGLATLRLLRDGAADTAVLVSPVTNLPTMYRIPEAVPELRSIYGKHPPRSANPIAWPPNALKGTTITVIGDPADLVVPFSTNGARFAKRFGAKLLHCHGGHAAIPCFAKVSFQ